ncbi:MAG: hypothetical protein J0H83_16605 [Candidatus Melainabacteria bacterium]|nr:hypothetical protein [Candidatus Melainabacteria bacterium]
MTKQALHIMLVVVLIATAASFSQATAAAPQGQKTWIIDEDENIVLVSPHAVHVHHKKNDFEIVCKAPEWRAYVFRHDKKLLYKRDLDKFTGPFLLGPLSNKIAIRTPAAFSKNTKFHGYDCAKYTTPSADIYASNEIQADPKAIEFLNRYWYIPVVPKVALYNTKVTSNANYKDSAWFNKKRYDGFLERAPLYTRKLSSKPFDSRDFAIPTDYKAASDCKDVCYGEANRKEIESMLNDVGFSDRQDSK